MLYIFTAVCELAALSLLFLRSASDSASVIAVLASASMCSLMIFFEDKKAVLFFAVLNFVLCFCSPAFVFFFAPVLFFAAFRKEFVSPVLCAAALIIFNGYAADLTGVVICAWALCFALGFSYGYGVFNYKKALSVRDEGAQENIKLTRRNKDLEKSVEYEAYRASLRERERIAGEMHDNAGHLLARSILMTGALKETAADEDLRDKLRALEDTLKEAMSQVRASVHKLKEDAMDLERAAKSCAAGFPNFKCRLNIDISKDVPSDVKYILVSAMRECFSNSARHSDADSIDLTVEEHPAFYKFTFKDNGSANHDFAPGMGLNGIAERARAAGGRAGFFVNGGFNTHIMLPKDIGKSKLNGGV